MHVVVTGAGGFVGTALVQRLLTRQRLGRHEITQLTLVDLQLDRPPGCVGVRLVEGDFGTKTVLDAICSEPVDVLFHLAGVSSGEAEREFARGYQVNLLSTTALLGRLAAQARVPRCVFTSSTAVFGTYLPDPLDDAALSRPTNSYGAHKLAVEIILSDLSRRGLVDGVSLRLAAIVARPGAVQDHAAGFMGAIVRAAAAGTGYTCPVSPAATCWWMSLSCCIDNLLYAVEALDAGRLGAERVINLPVLQHSVGEFVAALAQHFGHHAIAAITYQPEPAIEVEFGRMPQIDYRNALRLGFVHDGNLQRLIRNIL